MDKRYLDALCKALLIPDRVKQRAVILYRLLEEWNLLQDWDDQRKITAILYWTCPEDVLPRAKRHFVAQTSFTREEITRSFKDLRKVLYENDEILKFWCEWPSTKQERDELTKKIDWKSGYARYWLGVIERGEWPEKLKSLSSYFFNYFKEIIRANERFMELLEKWEEWLK